MEPILLLVMLAARAEAAGNADKPHVQATMVAELDKAVPGSPLWVGVRYSIEPGWHIYWENPGDSGMATELDVQAGPGLSAGPVQYPGPDRFDLPGGIANFGYEGEAALLVRVTPRAQLHTGELTHLSWSSSWLACKDACIRESAQGTLDLPIGTAATATRSEALAPFVARLPAPLSALGAEERWTGTKAAPERVIRVPGATSALFFPTRPLYAALSSERVEPKDGTTTLTLTVDPAALPGDARGVLRVETTTGPKWAEVPVPPPPADLP